MAILSGAMKARISLVLVASMAGMMVGILIDDLPNNESHPSVWTLRASSGSREAQKTNSKAEDGKDTITLSGCVYLLVCAGMVAFCFYVRSKAGTITRKAGYGTRPPTARWSRAARTAPS